MFTLALKNLLSTKTRTILTLISIIIGIASLSLLLALNEGIKTNIYETLARETPLKQITVKPKTHTFGISRIGQNVSNIDQEMLEKIKNIEHVQEIHPQIAYKNPASLSVEFLEHEFYTDSLIFGVPKSFIENDLKDPQVWNLEQTEVPTLIPKKILDLYNYSIATNYGLPILTEEILIGKTIEIHLNASYLSNQLEIDNGSSTHFTGKIVGFSDKINLIGITIPYEKVLELNENPEDIKYQQLFITVDDANEVPKVAAKIEEMELHTEYFQKNVQELNLPLKYLKITILLISIIILIIAGLMIISTFLSAVNERVKDIGMMRAIGATKNAINQIFLTESILLGTIGGIFGVLLALLASIIANPLAKKLFEKSTFQPENVFHIKASLIISVIIFSIIFSILSSIYPAYKASKLNPAEALKR